MLPSLIAIGLLILLTGLSYGIGRLATRRLTDDLTYLERFVFVVPVGMGVVGLIVWICGLLGFLSPILFWGLLCLGLPGYLVLLRDRGTTLPKPGNLKLPLGLLLTIAVVMGVLRVTTLIGALAPPSGLEWDALSYHLANQKTWLAHGRIDFLPWDHHSNFPFIAQMLYLLMLGVGSVVGAKLVHWLCFLLLGFSVYTFAARHIQPVERGRVVGAVAALIFASTPIVLWEATVAYVDLATALFTWLSLYALVNSVGTLPSPSLLPSPPSPLSRSAGEGEESALSGVEEGVREKGSLPWLILSAVLMGFALGTKYTVLGFWGILLIGILGWNLVVNRTWAKETIPHAALWGAISLALGLPWYIKNWIVAGNPVYPFAYNLFGGKYWSVENATQYAEEQAKFGFGKMPLDLILSPWRVTLEHVYLESYKATTGRPFIFTEYMIFGLSPVFVGLLLILPLIGRRLSRPSLYCLLFGFGVYAFWFLVMQQTRYLIPALPAFAVVIAEAVVLLYQETKFLARYLAAGLIALSAIWGALLSFGPVFLGFPYGPTWLVVAGQTTTRDYVERTLPGLGAACFWINDNTGKSDKVAIFDETRGFWLDREYVWAQPDHAAGLLPWDDYKDVDDWLADFKKRGYTTLLFGIPPESEKFLTTDKRRWRQLVVDAIQTGKISPAFDRGSFRVYRIP